MLRVLALTQFVLVALFTMALVILTKTEPNRGHNILELRHFLTVKCYWMVTIPIGYAVIGIATQKATSSPLAFKALQALGLAIIVAIVLVYGWLIATF